MPTQGLLLGRSECCVETFPGERSWDQRLADTPENKTTVYSVYLCSELYHIARGRNLPTLACFSYIVTLTTVEWMLPVDNATKIHLS